MKGEFNYDNNLISIQEFLNSREESLSNLICLSAYI